MNISCIKVPILHYTCIKRQGKIHGIKSSLLYFGKAHEILKILFCSSGFEFCGGLGMHA